MSLSVDSERLPATSGRFEGNEIVGRIRQTHCKRGHEKTPANTGLKGSCKPCAREYSKQRYEQHKTEKLEYYRQHRQVAKEYRRQGAGSRVWVICGTCKEAFLLLRGEYERRLEQKIGNGVHDGILFCSKPCAMDGKGPKNVKLKRKAWESEDQHFWEQVLHDARLGMGRGLRPWMEYGLHTYVESPNGKLGRRKARGAA